jgi:hypothetical protein
LNSTLAWVDIKHIGLWQGVTQVQVVSNDSFTLTELAAQYTRCFEMATLDMQDVYTVHVIRCGCVTAAAAISAVYLAPASGVAVTALSPHC